LKAKTLLSVAALLFSGCVLDPENFRSLEFYGRIVDQDGRPVAGMDVLAKVGTYEYIDQGGGSDHSTKSDSKGDFSFVWMTGAGVGFILTKPGYVYDQRLPSSTRPNDYKPESGNPVIFRVWRLKGPEPMVHTKITSGIPNDGTTVSFNPLTGRGNGDLEVTLARVASDADPKKPSDWNLTIGVRNGGIIENHDTYPNEAPASGYVPAITVVLRSGEKGGSSHFDRSYYFKSDGGGVFGRMDIFVGARFQPQNGLFGAEIFANPSGSRNLEFDPNKLAE
jgi:hypothetical protein